MAHTHTHAHRERESERARERERETPTHTSARQLNLPIEKSISVHVLKLIRSGIWGVVLGGCPNKRREISALMETE